MTFGQDYTPPEGIPAREALAQAVAKSEAAMRLVNELCTEVRQTKEAVGFCQEAVGRLTGEVSRISRRTVPPPVSSEVTGRFDVRGVVYQAVNAYREGERRSDTDPDTEVERVIERVENIRMGRRVRSLVTKAALAVVTLSGGWIGHVIWEAIKAGVK